MKSQRQIEREYTYVLKHWPDPIRPDHINCYICICGHVTKTIDRDPGVTPFMTHCEKCKALSAKSTFYRDIKPDQPATVEWYRPDLAATMKLRTKPDLLDHVLQGGLLSRKIKTDENNKGRN